MSTRLQLLCLILMLLAGCSDAAPHQSSHGCSEAKSPKVRVVRSSDADTALDTKGEVKGQVDGKHAWTGTVLGQAAAKVNHSSNFSFGYNSKDGLDLNTVIDNKAAAEGSGSASSFLKNFAEAKGEGFFNTLLNALSKLGSRTSYEENLTTDEDALLYKLELAIFGPRPQQYAPQFKQLPAVYNSYPLRDTLEYGPSQYHTYYAAPRFMPIEASFYSSPSERADNPSKYDYEELPPHWYPQYDSSLRS